MKNKLCLIGAVVRSCDVVALAAAPWGLDGAGRWGGVCGGLRSRAGLAAFALLVALACWPGAALAVSPGPGGGLEEAAGQLAGAATAQGQAQAEADAWAVERDALRDEIRREGETLAWLEAALTRRGDYIARREAVVAGLHDSAREMAALERGLEPVLDAVLARLEELVAADLAFLPGERRQRLDMLRETLGDYGLAPGEKLRRFLEALQVEAGYGALVEAWDDAIDLGGSRVQGRVLRLGRAAALFLSRDGAQAARLVPGATAWEALGSSQARTLAQALEMHDHRRAFELLALPVGTAQLGAQPGAPGGVQP